MSDQIFEQFASGMRMLNTELTKAFAPDGTRCFLIRRMGETSKFSVVKELEAGFFVEFNEYRGQLQFTYADPDLSFRDDFAQADHIAYGVPSETGKIEVFAFSNSPDAEDIVDPNGTSPFWKVFVSKDRQVRFTVPETEETP